MNNVSEEVQEYTECFWWDWMMDRITAIRQALPGIQILNVGPEYIPRIPVTTLNPLDYEKIKHMPIDLELKLNCNLRKYEITSRLPMQEGQKANIDSEKIQIKKIELTRGGNVNVYFKHEWIDLRFNKNESWSAYSRSFPGNQFLFSGIIHKRAPCYMLANDKLNQAISRLAEGHFYQDKILPMEAEFCKFIILPLISRLVILNLVLARNGWLMRNSFGSIR